MDFAQTIVSWQLAALTMLRQSHSTRIISVYMATVIGHKGGSLPSGPGIAGRVIATLNGQSSHDPAVGPDRDDLTRRGWPEQRVVREAQPQEVVGKFW